MRYSYYISEDVAGTSHNRAVSDATLPLYPVLIIPVLTRFEFLTIADCALPTRAHCN